MNGATFAYYWVDVTNPSYTTGDRTTPIYTTSYPVITLTPELNCVVVGVVTVEGTGNSTGPICY